MPDDHQGVTEEFRRRVAALGFELVDLRRRGSESRPLIQARIDRPNSTPGHGVTVGDCAGVSRALERWLDETGAVGEHYVLEVSSPGVERPVRWPEHWRRFVGREVNVKVPSRGRVRATIVEVADDDREVILRPRGATDTITVPLEQARDATLAVDWD